MTGWISRGIRPPLTLAAPAAGRGPRAAGCGLRAAGCGAAGLWGCGPRGRGAAGLRGCHPVPRDNVGYVATDDGKPPMARLLSAGAKRAERVARATGVDQAFDEAVEEAIVRALRSPAIIRAIERAMEDRGFTVALNADQLAAVVKQALESEVAGDAWAEILASEQAQMLVERIAGAPEIRDAIKAQSAGLITDIGVRLTKLTEALDDALEKVTRHRDPDSETNQAGLATRVAAAAIDLGLLAVAYSLASTVFASVISFAFGSQLSLGWAIGFGVLGFIVGGGIFASFWALAGQTPGMRFLSIRIVRHGAHHLPVRIAIKRLFGVMLSLVPLGLGYFVILRNPSRHAWVDRLTQSEVVYDVVNRSAPYSGAGAPTTTARVR